MSNTIAVFWSLYFNKTSLISSFKINPYGASISFTEYSPSGSSFDVAFPSEFVMIVSTTVPFLYNTVPSLDGSNISSFANISYLALGNPFSS